VHFVAVASRGERDHSGSTPLASVARPNPTPTNPTIGNAPSATANARRGPAGVYDDRISAASVYANVRGLGHRV
jgi:hypothetical protein